MSKRKAQSQQPAAPQYPKVVETFMEPGLWWLGQMRQDTPSCFNGIVRVRRYRVTVEEIVESRDVLCARLQDMWGRADNHHEWAPLRAVAASLNYELQGDAGAALRLARGD